MKKKLQSKQIYVTIILLVIFIVGIGVFAFIKYMQANYYSIDISETPTESIQNQPEDTAEINEDFKPPSDEEKIKQSGYSYVYSKSQNKWREYRPKAILAPDDILVSKGDEGKCFMLYFSSYQHKYLNKKLLGGCGRTFIKNNKMYTFDYSILKMDEIVAKGSNFQVEKKSIVEIQKLYPNAEIIKVSDFKNGYLKITKTKSAQTYLLLSDTDYSGYNYGVGGCGFELKMDNDFVTFTINTDKAKVVHAFFGDCDECSDENPCLTMEFDTIIKE